MTQIMGNSTVRYKVLQGEISQLHTEDIHVHYLENIKQHQQTAGAVAVLQAAVGHAGAVNSAQAATYDGDPVNGFIMQVGGKTVHGSSWKTTFKNGDRVQIIGQERGKVFEAVAVVKPDERIIWMQPHCERGTQSQKQNLVKCCGWFSLFMYACAFLLVIFSDWQAWFAFVSASLAIPFLLFFTVGMSWGDFMGFARQMNAVGEAMGLPEPDKLDLFRSTKNARQSGKPDLPIGVYYY